MNRNYNKKLFSVILALVMVIGTMGMSFAAMPDIAGTPIEPAVERLVGLGVLTGYPDGTFRPNEPITRAEYATIVYKATQLTMIPGATGFGDVPEAHWAAKFIKAATQAGLIKGRGLINGVNTFDPEANISYQEAVTLVVRALGYESLAESNGGYPTGHMLVAEQKNLLEGIGGNLSLPASRALVARLTFNALEVKKNDGLFLFNELHMINEAAESGDWTGIDASTFTDAGINGVTSVNLENLQAILEVMADGSNPNWLPSDVVNVVAARGALAQAIGNAESLDKDDFTTASWAAADLATEIPAAKAVLVNESAGQSQIDAAKVALDAAVAELELKVPLTAVDIAEEAVVVAETTMYDTDIAAAQALVDALPAGPDRVALQVRIDAIVPVTDLGVRAAEGVTTQDGVDAVAAVAAVTGVKGTVTVDTDIVLTAANTLTDGSEISITVTQQTGADKNLIVDLSGKEIQVGLATNALGNAKTTRAEVVAAINAHSGASALVVASGGSSALAAPVANTPLAGGVATVEAEPAVNAEKVIYEVKITSGADKSGNITVIGVGGNVNVAVLNGMSPELVAQEIANSAGLIANATAAGYVMTAEDEFVVFTAINAGAIGGTGPAAALSVTVK
ncbi:MAG: S-layer homology domain-containing protein [Gudongella sp.]|nr:S-layer homology domain-containing protein [Gudongella sp.]